MLDFSLCFRQSVLFRMRRMGPKEWGTGGPVADRTRSRRSRILRTGIALARRVVAIAIDPSLFLEWEEMSAKLVTAREAERALQVRLDQKCKSVRELEGLVGIDPLTGVANRLGSEAAFERLVRITQRGRH